MTRPVPMLVASLVAVGVCGWLAVPQMGSVAVARPHPAAVAADAAQPPAPAAGPEAGIKAITDAYVKAFNAADAKAAAGLWTAAGEYVGADGEVVVGREAIEKDLAEFFAANPKATVTLTVESVQPRGRGLAVAEGVLRVKRPGEPEAGESRYSALHVLEDGQWLAASVREWVPDAALDVTIKNLEWLVGEWSAKGEGGVAMTITYAWDEDRTFVTGRYAVTRDGKSVSKGTQVIGTNPAGGLRSWMFDSTGTTSDSVWTRDGTRWLNEASGLLPDGTEVTSTNVIVPLGPDAFTWQTTARAINGTPAAGLPPVKVTRTTK